MRQRLGIRNATAGSLPFMLPPRLPPVAPGLQKPLLDIAKSLAVPTKTPIVRAKPPKPVRNVAASRPKLIRGDFAIPETEYALIAELKATAKRGGSKVKKNELLRLGLQSLQSLSPAELHDRILAMQLPDKGITK